MAPEEQTFRAYTQKQGEMYAVRRPGYPLELFKVIVDHHASTGGQRDTVLDVGCGPGQGTHGIAPYFAHTIALDPSEGMITTARAIPSSTESGASPIRFEVSTAETLGTDLEPPIADGSIDLITAATAAHWFDMERFWPSAARVLKPGGTVALWTSSRPFIHPRKTPNAAAIQAAIDDTLSGEELRPYKVQGNDITNNLYVDLPLPWTIESPVEEFDKNDFSRKEWNKREDDEVDELFSVGRPFTPAEVEAVMGTGSPVTRWREAHPDKVGTEEDILRRLRRRIEGLLHEAGVEPGKEELIGDRTIVLLMVKKRA